MNNSIPPRFSSPPAEEVNALHTDKATPANIEKNKSLKEVFEAVINWFLIDCYQSNHEIQKRIEAKIQTFDTDINTIMGNGEDNQAKLKALTTLGQSLEIQRKFIDFLIQGQPKFEMLTKLKLEASEISKKAVVLQSKKDEIQVQLKTDQLNAKYANQRDAVERLEEFKTAYNDSNVLSQIESNLSVYYGDETYATFQDKRSSVIKKMEAARGAGEPLDNETLQAWDRMTYAYIDYSSADFTARMDSRKRNLQRIEQNNANWRRAMHEGVFPNTGAS